MPSSWKLLIMEQNPSECVRRIELDLHITALACIYTDLRDISGLISKGGNHWQKPEPSVN